MVDEQPTSALQPIGDTLAVNDLTDKDRESGKQPAYSRLSRAEEAQILRLSVEGLTQVQIAAQLGRSQSTVSHVLADFANTTEIARKHLESRAIQAAEAWTGSLVAAAEKGDHKPAKELLQAVGVVQKDGPSQAQQVQVVVGMPGSTAYCDPLNDPG
jgi:DNA-binding CsgD family transcriptional regulator